MKAFQTLPIASRKSVTIKINVSQAESLSIHQAAEIRVMSVSEFMRRAALGSKADTQCRTEIVLQLVAVARIFWHLNEDMCRRGFTLPYEILTPRMQSILKAIATV